MNNSRKRAFSCAAGILLVLSASAQISSPALASNESLALLSETPKEATMSAPPPISPTSPATPTYLYGSVKQRGSGVSGNVQDSSEPSQSTNLQSETPAQARAKLKAAAYSKLSQGFELSSEEYRALGIGCIGYESLRTFFQPEGKITAVYKNSPAEKAGLKVGETILQDFSDDEAKTDPTVPLWSVSLAKEGDPVNITVKRHGRAESLTILRFNIEDIEDPAIRKGWEKIVRDLGFPKKGVFTGKSFDSLHRTSDDAN